MDFTQLRNKLGETAYGSRMQEGLKPVKGLNDAHTALINRINKATTGDTLDNRMVEACAKRKAVIKKAKANGLIDKSIKFVNFGLDRDGNFEKELI